MAFGKDVSTSRVLFAFDFDRTLIDENSDAWILRCVPELQLQERVKDLRREFSCWLDMMHHVMKLIHESGCGKERILDWMKKLSLIGGMGNVLCQIRDHPLAEAIIASDANTVFISTVLEANGCLDCVKEIHSNPARFEQSEQLMLSRYHSHTCVRCAKNVNMCKGTIMRDVIAKGEYSQVIYIGDGTNDLCPSLQLSSNDHVVAREGRSLAKHLRKMSAEVKPQIHVVDFASQDTESLLISFLPHV